MQTVGEPAGGAEALVMQFVPLIFLSLIFVLPSLRILRRAGLSRWWAVLVLIPFFGWAALQCFIAFAKWPAAKGHDEIFS